MLSCLWIKTCVALLNQSHGFNFLVALLRSWIWLISNYFEPVQIRYRVQSMEIFFLVLASNTAFAVSWRIARKPWGSFMLLLCTWFGQAAQLSIFYFRKIREVAHFPETCLSTGTLFWEIGTAKERVKKKIQHLAEFEPTTSLITMRALYCCAILRVILSRHSGNWQQLVESRFCLCLTDSYQLRLTCIDFYCIFVARTLQGQGRNKIKVEPNQQRRLLRRKRREGYYEKKMYSLDHFRIDWEWVLSIPL